jgi:hypothetical protein
MAMMVIMAIMAMMMDAMHTTIAMDTTPSVRNGGNA